MSEQLRTDSWLSVLGSFATQRQRLASMHGGLVNVVEMYENDGLAARIVDLVAEDALSRGLEVEGDPERFISDEMDRLDATNVLTDGLRWARLHGAGAILMLVDDGLDLSDPLDLARIQSVSDIVAYPGSALSAEPLRYTDPTKRNYGEPALFRVQPRQGMAFICHESRLLRLPGDPVSYRGGVSHVIPWQGRSVLASCMVHLERHNQSLELVRAILERKQQPVYQMAGLGEMMAQGMEGVVQSRLALTDMVRGILTTVAVDAGDNFTIADSSLGGVSDVLDVIKISLAASSGYTMPVLFGQTTSGLSANDESAEGIYHQRVRQAQERCLRPALELLIAAIYAQKTARHPEPESWHLKFNPLWSPTEVEMANARKANAEARVAEIGALDALLVSQLVTPEEMRDFAREAFPEYMLTVSGPPILEDDPEPEIQPDDPTI